MNGEASNNNGGVGAEHPGPTYDGASNDSGGCGLGAGMGLILLNSLLLLLRFRRS